MRILYIDVDSLRPDHTTPYGYRRDLTPNLQRVADQAVRFGHYYCSDSPCVPSRAALSSQRFGINSGVIGHYGAAADLRLPSARAHDPATPLLGGYLIEQGYRTAAVSCFAERHLTYWFHGNFLDFHRPRPPAGTKSGAIGNDEDAADVNAAAIGWLNQHGRDDDWFLFVNYWDVHNDYFIPAEWARRAAEAGPPPAWPDEEAITAQQQMYGPRSPLDLHGIAGESSPTPDTMPDAIRGRADFDHLINGYDGAIMYWDHHLGQLLDALDQIGILDETVIIVSADHGEAFGENGVYADHCFANEPTHRVPLIIRWPGITDHLADRQRGCDALLYNLDLGPTLCDLLDLPIPAGWDGTSFADAVRGDPIASRTHLVFSHGAHTYQRAVRTRDHLYIRTLHPGSFRVDPEQLYDLAADPHLTRSVMTDQPEMATQHKALLDDWWHAHVGRPGAGPDPMQTTIDPGPTAYVNPDDYLAHLEASGRAHLAKDLRTRLGSSHNQPAATDAGRFTSAGTDPSLCVRGTKERSS